MDMNRRTFLRGALAVGGGLALATALPKPAVAAIESLSSEETTQETTTAELADENQGAEEIQPATTVQTHEDVASEKSQSDTNTEESVSIWSDFPEWYQELGSPDQTIGESVLQGFLADALIIPSTLALSKLGLPVGNAGLRELFNDPDKLAKLPHASTLFLLMAGVAPVYEELKYRALPSAVLNFAKRNDASYETTSGALVPALLSSAWFAQAHNKNAEKMQIPLPQFAMGMLFWRQLRNSGVVHPMATHAATNAFIGGIALPFVEQKRKAAIASQKEERTKGAVTILREGLLDAERGRDVPRRRTAPRELSDEEVRRSIRRVFGDGPNDKPLH